MHGGFLRRVGGRLAMPLMVQENMVVHSESIAIHAIEPSQNRQDTKELVDALVDVSKSRSTRDIIRDSQQHQVKCALRVPLLKGSHPVQAAELGRALRRVMRAAIDAASPGDHVLVDFIVTSSSCLDVKAGPAAEMSGGLFRH